MTNTQEFEMIPVSKLYRAPENVRKTNLNAGHDELKASILAKGVLQNLIVYPGEGEKFAVVGGGRRFKVLGALVKEKKLPKTFEVPCLVRPRAEAVELSLTENAQREAMHPADAFEAYAALIDNGASIEDVAARFGITPAVVTRRMKLAKVAPAILAAYRADKLSLEGVMAFTVSDDHAEQKRVYAALAKQYAQVGRDAVLRALTHDKAALTDPRFLYVGEADYLAAGGTISRDLFDKANSGYADDSALLDRLALDKLALEAPAYLAQGWKWVEPITDFAWDTANGHGRIHAKKKPLDPETNARYQQLEQRIEEILEQTDGEEPEDGPLAEEYAAASKEIEAIEAARGEERSYDPQEMALAGGWVSLTKEGKLRVELGYVKRADAAALAQLAEAARRANNPDLAEDETEGKGGAIPAAPGAEAKAGLSEALMTDLHAARTIALRLELANRPDIALRAVAHNLAAKIIMHGTDALAISPRSVTVPEISKAHCPSNDELAARIGHWSLRLPSKAEALWGAILALSDEDLLDLIAVCAAMTVDANYQKHADSASHQRMSHAAQLATTLQLDMAKHWQPTAPGFLGRVSKTAILEAVTEGAGPAAASRLDGLKKPVMAAEAEKALAGTGWVPAVLRTTA